MSSELLFTAALGLSVPWHVRRVEFQPSEKVLHLELDFEEGGRFACPTCGTLCPAYDTTERTWRHLNFFEHRTFLHARFPRVACPDHGVVTVTVPWAREGSGFTLLFEAWALLLCQQMSVLAAARLLEIQDTRLWRLVRHHVDQARAEEDFSGLTQIGIDDVARRQGHDYLTICTDHERRRVVAVVPGRGKPAVTALSEELQKYGANPKQIQVVSRDLAPSYSQGITDCFPKCRQIADPFHVAQLVQEAVDQTRRQEAKQETKLKRSRYLWLKRRVHLTDKEQVRLQELEALPLKTVCAYHFKEEFHALWQQPDARTAATFLANWNQRVQTSNAGTTFCRMAQNLMAHAEEIFNYHRTGGKITNGICEAINGLIDGIKEHARGFRNTEYLTTIIYLTQGKLDIKLPTLNSE